MQWVQRNRSRRADRATATGTLILEFARSLGEPQGELRQAVIDSLTRIVDAEFVENCRLQLRPGGLVSVQVLEPARLVLIKRKWSGSLHKALHKLGVRQVIFELGDGGMKLPQPMPSISQG